MMKTKMLVAVLVSGLSIFFAWSSLIAEEMQSFGPDRQLYETTVGRAIQFLAVSQSQDGSISSHVGIGPTALAALGVLKAGQPPSDPLVVNALKYIEQYVQENGGIYMPGSHISSYETCIALVCFNEANRDGRYDPILHQGEAFQQKSSVDGRRSQPGHGLCPSIAFLLPASSRRRSTINSLSF